MQIVHSDHFSKLLQRHSQASAQSMVFKEFLRCRESSVWKAQTFAVFSSGSQELGKAFCHRVMKSSPSWSQKTGDVRAIHGSTRASAEGSSSLSSSLSLAYFLCSPETIHLLLRISRKRKHMIQKRIASPLTTSFIHGAG